MLAALDLLEDAALANLDRLNAILARAETVRKLLEDGAAMQEVMAAAPGTPLAVLTRDNLSELARAGAAVRRAQARCLREEGLTMEQIASILNVSRQRVSEVLQR